MMLLRNGGVGEVQPGDSVVVPTQTPTTTVPVTTAIPIDFQAGGNVQVGGQTVEELKKALADKEKSEAIWKWSLIGLALVFLALYAFKK